LPRKSKSLTQQCLAIRASPLQFLQDGLEAIRTKNVVMETNTHNTPAVIRPAGEEEYLYILMPMPVDG
jgi:DNA polymerase-3 subunit beta